MSLVERILQAQRDKLNRQDAAFKAVWDLPQDERESVLARLIDAVERSSTPTPATSPGVTSEPDAAPADGHRVTYVERAVAFVRQHPNGVYTRDVAQAIGQDTSAVDGTLRLALKRGLVVRRDRFWFAPGTFAEAEPNRPPRRTIRDIIQEVFGEENRPRGAAEIFKGAAALKPDINRASVDGEINRMRADKLLAPTGHGPRGALYALVRNGGGQPEG